MNTRSFDPPWDNLDEYHLWYLWEMKKLPARVIGDLMGRSKNAVVGKAHRMKLTGRESPIRHDKGLRPTQKRSAALSLAINGHKTQSAVIPEVPDPLEQRASVEVPGKVSQDDDQPHESNGRNGCGCVFPVGELGDENFHCGKEVFQIEGASARLRRRSQYCHEHLIVMFGKIPTVESKKITGEEEILARRKEYFAPRPLPNF